jgi:hypothetical protein
MLLALTSSTFASDINCRSDSECRAGDSSTSSKDVANIVDNDFDIMAGSDVSA